MEEIVLRPVYETDRDRSREQSLLTKVAEATGLRADQMRKFSRMDFALSDDEGVKALCEVKVRSHCVGHYPTVMINLDKVLTAHTYALVTRIPTILLVSFLDGVRWCRLDTHPDRVAIGGRTDRGDPMDVDLMAHYEASQMRTLSELNHDLCYGYLRRIAKDRDSRVLP